MITLIIIFCAIYLLGAFFAYILINEVLKDSEISLGKRRLISFLIAIVFTWTAALVAGMLVIIQSCVD